MFKKGYKQTEGHKQKIGKANKVSLRGQRHSPNTEFKKGHIPKTKSMIGILSPLWKGGAKESRRRSYQRNKEKFKKRVIARRALLKGAGGFHSVGEWENMKAQYNWTCPSCLISEPIIKLTVDHVIPLIKGGSNNIENIQPLCKSCNCKKSRKIIRYEYGK